MAKFQRWTKEEDEILVQAIKANPHNKIKAIREVLPKLNDRTESAAAYRWYQVLSNPENKQYVGSIYTMVGYGTKYVNRTVNREKVHVKPQKSSKTIWSRIKKILGI